MTNLVAYRGHENPIWDVEWSPLGNYFVTGSRDRTARLWSTERIKALRVFAGHLSDVDVSPHLHSDDLVITYLTRSCSALNSIQILYISLLVQVIRLVDYGMFNAAHVFVSLLGTKVRSPRSQLPRMGDIWLVPVRVSHSDLTLHASYLNYLRARQQPT
jgi:WD40 repeat protein